VALLASWSRDIELAEDCVAEAYAAAAQRWPADGVPTSPEGWLVTVARNRLRDTVTSAHAKRTQPLGIEHDRAHEPEPEIDGQVPDQRLALKLASAHPAIDEAIRAPLMLNVVLGVHADRIASVWGVSSAAMAQRLVRAKRRIRDAGIPFAVPDENGLAARLPGLLEAMYGAFCVDWDEVVDLVRDDRAAAEALFLVHALARQTQDPEVWGLAALMCFVIARAPARAGGSFVPLEAQDPGLWDAELIAAGEQLLSSAARARRPGRFQWEAAIQSAHCARARTGATDYDAICALYDALIAVAPTLGAGVARAAAIGARDGAAAGLGALDVLGSSADALATTWAVRAHFLESLGRSQEAAHAYGRAEGLTRPGVMRDYLGQRRHQALAPDPTKRSGSRSAPH
jgi:RNA polymerase sigma-70 factor (ECF subfamily)